MLPFTLWIQTVWEQTEMEYTITHCKILQQMDGNFPWIQSFARKPRQLRQVFAHFKLINIKYQMFCLLFNCSRNLQYVSMIPM